MSRATLRPKNQITIPNEVRRALHIEDGDEIEFAVTAEGVVLRGLKRINAEQAWFWSEQWQAGEREASKELAAGQGVVYDDEASFLASFDED